MEAQPWLDSLSEDWISQTGTSSPSVRSSNVSSASHNASDLNNQIQSRIPRLRLRAATSHARSRKSSQRSVSGGGKKQRTPLTERTASQNNTFGGNGYAEPEDASLELGSASSASDCSATSVVRCATMERKAPETSAANAENGGNTPEWKRRLLKGERGYGEQLDLFGPIGLENIFQPQPMPSVRGRGKNQASFLRMAPIELIPSSPPPWPSPAANISKGTAINSLGAEAQRLSMVDEADEESTTDHSVANREVADDGSVRSYSRSKTEIHDSSEHPLSHESQSLSTSQNEDASQAPESRIVSGQTEMRNEQFSPVFLSQHTSASGRVNYTASGLVGKEGGKKVEDAGAASGSLRRPSATRVDIDSRDLASCTKLEDEALPEDLSVGTPDIAELGEFVSVKRGGHSASGSFQIRPLSPSPNSNEVTEQESSGVQDLTTASFPSEQMGKWKEDTSKSNPYHLNKAPTTPERRQRNEHRSPEKTHSSGSPLKLFGDHDTFTSHRLLRRMSQLEDTVRMEQVVEVSQADNVVKLSKSSRTQKSVSNQDDAQPTQLTYKHEIDIVVRQASTGKFGQGDLDGYRFPGQILPGPQVEEDDSEDDASLSPSPSAAPPGSRPPLRFRAESSSGSDPAQGQMSKVSGSSSATVIPLKTHKKRRSSRVCADPDENSVQASGTEQQLCETVVVELKRPQNSPGKSPAPKRRRTLQSIDVVDSITAQFLGATDDNIVSGRERKEARVNSSGSFADAEAFARRQILRPRNPTPSQRRQRNFSADSIRTNDHGDQTQEKVIKAEPELVPSRGGLKPPAVLPSLNQFTLPRTRPAKGVDNDERKHSLTTQDYLDEAMRVMSWIRKNGRPKSGLESLVEGQESGEEADQEVDVPSILTFSRPPSRDGAAGGWRAPQLADFDSKVLSHLRKFEDNDDDDFMASTLRSLAVRQKQEDDEVPIEPGDAQGDDSIRIMKPWNGTPPGPTNGDAVTSPGATKHETRSSRSVDFSSGRTALTNTSRKSDNVATLALDAIAHLIPQEIAGMSYDSERKVWVKTKSPRKDPTRGSDASAVTESDEDPLGKIPDLTVDEIRELQPINFEAVTERHPIFSHESLRNLREEVKSARNIEKQAQVYDSRPSTSESGPSQPADASSGPSRFACSAFSAVQTETRATSWSEAGTHGIQPKEKVQAPTAPSPEERGDVEEAENEPNSLVLHNAANARLQEAHERSARRKGSTPAIGDPFSLHFSKSEPSTNVRLAAELRNSKRTTSQVTPQAVRVSAAGNSDHGQARSRGPSKGLTFTNRLLSHLEESGEVSIVTPGPDKRRMNFSVSISKPTRTSDAGFKPLVLNPPTPCSRTDVTLYLSDLPDFTVNQVDERELPDRALSKREIAYASKASESRYALATMDLVKRLQDVEPDEPFWDELRLLDLCDTGLTTLHMLDDFCCRLESLDVSDNRLTQLNGAPSSVRRLEVRKNSLSSLTSWGHLMNLQYLDVSGNDIDDPSAFSSLIHLRELRADDNAISNLDGIQSLDGLITLSLKRNRVRQIDFEGSDLIRLRDLDLSGNQLSEVLNLHCLPSLERINLDNNKLVRFPAESQRNFPCRSLRSLLLRANVLESLHIGSCFPGLKELYVDRNNLSEAADLSGAAHLEVFSFRDQQVGLDVSTRRDLTSTHCYLNHHDLRTAYVSGNVVPALHMKHDFLNLAHLELASSGLQSLPERFGQLAPNIRVLNLNFNALTDVKPLLNIKKLRELYLVGNRLSRLRKTVTVISKLETLSTLDLRDNPFTVGFYMPAVHSQIVTNKSDDWTDDGSQPFLLPSGDEEKDQSYAARLDDTTRLRRRVYEMLLASSCSSLGTLDGLPFARYRVLIKDETWDRLMTLGVVKKSAACAQ